MKGFLGPDGFWGNLSVIREGLLVLRADASSFSKGFLRNILIELLSKRVVSTTGKAFLFSVSIFGLSPLWLALPGCNTISLRTTIRWIPFSFPFRGVSPLQTLEAS